MRDFKQNLALFLISATIGQTRASTWRSNGQWISKNDTQYIMLCRLKTYQVELYFFFSTPTGRMLIHLRVTPSPLKSTLNSLVSMRTPGRIESLL